MRYKDYDIDDFLLDEFFIQWIKDPNENNSHFWEKWLEQHPEKREVIMKAVTIISSIHYTEKSVVGDKIYIETFENIVKAERDYLNKRDLSCKIKKWNFPFHFRQVAATLLILFCIGMVYTVIFHPIEKLIIKNEIVTIKRANPSGKKSMITLSDGTRIYLNSESEISYTPEFSDSLRVVSLKGEAFFEVQKESRPFVVETQETKIHVLGTSFNVNQRDNGSLMVALVTGKVRVNDQRGNQVNLEPREMMVMEKGGHLYKTGFDPLEITAWKDKVLVFSKSTFAEVIGKVETWFGVKVQLSGKIDPDWSYSGIYRDETLENVLRGIFHTSGLSYKIEGKNVNITNPK